MSYQLTTTILGLLLASMILYLVRRDHLHGPYAYWWLTVAAATVILGFKPKVIDALSQAVGVTYPPSLLFALVIGLMLIKMLKSDIERSRHERKIRRLAQHLAILQEDNRRLREDVLGQQTESTVKKTAAR